MKALKSSSLALVIVVVGLLPVLGTWADAQSPSNSAHSKIVIGEVSLVQGEFHMTKDLQGLDQLDIVDTSYVITDRAGKEWRLELSDDTKVSKAKRSRSYGFSHNALPCVSIAREPMGASARCCVASWGRDVP